MPKCRPTFSQGKAVNNSSDFSFLFHSAYPSHFLSDMSNFLMGIIIASTACGDSISLARRVLLEKSVLTLGSPLGLMGDGSGRAG